MRVGPVRSILWLTAAVASAIGVLAIVTAVATPLDEPVVVVPAAPRRTVAAADAGDVQKTRLPPLESFEAAWRMPLRRPLVDPPPPPAMNAKASKPAGLSVRLIGTIVDGQRPRGVFMIGLAAVELKGVGEKAGGAEIVAIDDNTATLSYLGETVVLRREKNPFDSTGARYDAAVRSNPAAEPKTNSDNGS